VHNAAAGQRNACLYVASVALGQLVAGGALPEHDAHITLLSAAVVAPSLIPHHPPADSAALRTFVRLNR
jgi:hypothetical protein